jgi:hypothetical protein
LGKGAVVVLGCDKIIDAEWEEIPPDPMPEPKAKREFEINKFYLAVNIILLGAICKLIYTAFYWASLLR